MKCKIEVKRKKGFVSEVSNKCGNRKPVEIFQGSKSGFSARYVGSKRNLSETGRNDEAFAKKLAKKGHKKVVFRD